MILKLEQESKILEYTCAASTQEHILQDLRKLKLELNNIIDKWTKLQIQTSLEYL